MDPQTNTNRKEISPEKRQRLMREVLVFSVIELVIMFIAFLPLSLRGADCPNTEEVSYFGKACVNSSVLWIVGATLPILGGLVFSLRFSKILNEKEQKVQ